MRTPKQWLKDKTIINDNALWDITTTILGNFIPARMTDCTCFATSEFRCHRSLVKNSHYRQANGTLRAHLISGQKLKTSCNENFCISYRFHSGFCENAPKQPLVHVGKANKIKC